MKTSISYYVLCVWLTSVMVSPVIVSLFMAWQEGTFPDKELIPLMLMWGGLCSIPSLILLGMSCAYLVHRKTTVKAVKIPLTLIAILLTYTPFWILNGLSFADHSGASVLFWPYCLTIVAGIWFYQLKIVAVVKVEEAGGDHEL